MWTGPGVKGSGWGQGRRRKRKEIVAGVRRREKERDKGNEGMGRYGLIQCGGFGLQ